MASVLRSRANTVALWVLAVVALLFFLRAASQLLIPIVIAVLISYALEPVVAWLGRHHVPRLAGATLTLLVLVGLCGWGVYSLRDDVQQMVESLPEAARRARQMVTSQSGSRTSSSIQEAASVLQGGQGAASGDTGATGTMGQEGGGTADSQSPPGGGSRTAGSSPAGWIQWGVGSIVALAGHITVIFFLVFFLLISGHHFRNRFVEIAGSDAGRRRTVAAIVDEINQQIQRFLLVRLVTGIIVAAATWLVLALMGVQNAAVWGILAGVFNSIPYFGPVIVSGGLLVVGLVQGGGITQALQMAGAALAITSLEGWLLEPPLMGRAERMSAIAVFLGLLLWSWIWGAWGTILAVPMLVVLKSVADHVDPLKPVGRLLAPESRAWSWQPVSGIRDPGSEYRDGDPTLKAE